MREHQNTCDPKPALKGAGFFVCIQARSAPCFLAPFLPPCPPSTSDADLLGRVACGIEKPPNSAGVMTRAQVNTQRLRQHVTDIADRIRAARTQRQQTLSPPRTAKKCVACGQRRNCEQRLASKGYLRRELAGLAGHSVPALALHSGGTALIRW